MIMTLAEIHDALGHLIVKNPDMALLRGTLTLHLTDGDKNLSNETPLIDVIDDRPEIRRTP